MQKTKQVKAKSKAKIQSLKGRVSLSVCALTLLYIYSASSRLFFFRIVERATVIGNQLARRKIRADYSQSIISCDKKKR